MIKEIVKNQLKLLFLPVFTFSMFYGISNMNSYDYSGSIINLMGGTITNFVFYIIILSVNIIVYSIFKNTSIFIRYKNISKHMIFRKVIELICSYLWVVLCYLPTMIGNKGYELRILICILIVIVIYEIFITIFEIISIFIPKRSSTITMSVFIFGLIVIINDLFFRVSNGLFDIMIYSFIDFTKIIWYSLLLPLYILLITLEIDLSEKNSYLLEASK